MAKCEEEEQKGAKKRKECPQRSQNLKSMRSALTAQSFKAKKNAKDRKKTQSSKCR